MKLYLVPQYKEKLDLISLFPNPKSIECDEKYLYQLILASLHQKNEILIFKSTQPKLPSWNSTKRWEVGDSWLWLSSRSKAPIVKTFCGTIVTLSQLTEFLSVSK